MALYQLLYISRATDRIDRAELHDIAAFAAGANNGRHVSGMLLYCGGLFVQMLEGESDVIRPLFDKISTDKRHVDVQELACTPTSARLYPDWAMAGLHEDDLASASPDERVRVDYLLARVQRHHATIDALPEDARGLLSDLRLALFDAEEAA